MPKSSPTLHSDLHRVLQLVRHILPLGAHSITDLTLDVRGLDPQRSLGHSGLEETGRMGWDWEYGSTGAQEGLIARRGGCDGRRIGRQTDGARQG